MVKIFLLTFKEALNKIEAFSDKIRQGLWKGYSEK
jgi:hypothetical protein